MSHDRQVCCLLLAQNHLKKDQSLEKNQKTTDIGRPLCLFLTLELSRFYLNASRSTAWLHHGWTTVDKACAVVSNSPPASALDSKKKMRRTPLFLFFCLRPKYFLQWCYNRGKLFKIFWLFNVLLLLPQKCWNRLYKRIPTISLFWQQKAPQIIEMQLKEQFHCTGKAYF